MGNHQPERYICNTCGAEVAETFYGACKSCFVDSYDDYDDSPGIGCANCDGGWSHGCCDDLCRGSNEPEWCENAIACWTCNPHGEV